MIIDGDRFGASHGIPLMTNAAATKAYVVASVRACTPNWPAMTST